MDVCYRLIYQSMSVERQNTHIIRYSQTNTKNQQKPQIHGKPAFPGSENLFRADGISATCTLLCIAAEEQPPPPPKESRVASIPLCFMVWNVSQSSIDVEHPVLEGRGQSQLPPDSFSSSQKVLLETHLNLRIEGTWGVPELARRPGAWKCTLGNGIIYFPVRSVAMTGEVGTEVV